MTAVGSLGGIGEHFTVPYPDAKERWLHDVAESACHNCKILLPPSHCLLIAPCLLFSTTFNLAWQLATEAQHATHAIELKFYPPPPASPVL